MKHSTDVPADSVPSLTPATLYSLSATAARRRLAPDARRSMTPERLAVKSMRDRSWRGPSKRRMTSSIRSTLESKSSWRAQVVEYKRKGSMDAVS